VFFLNNSKCPKSLFIILASIFFLCDSFSQELSLYKQIAEKIESDYYDVKRLKSDKFIKAFSEAISFEFSLYEINVEGRNVLVKYRKKIIKNIRIKDKSVTSALEICFAIYDCIKKNCNNEEKYKLSLVQYKGLYRALKTMDPHSAIYDPILSKELILRSGNLKLDIGLDFILEDGDIVVKNIYESSTAETAGIKEGDIITTINEQPLLGLSLKSVRALIKKSPDFVKIILLKKDTGFEERYQLEKVLLKQNNVDAFLINGEVGYFKIKRFSVGSFKAFKEKLENLKHGKGKSVYWEEGEWKVEKLTSKGGIQSFILDLRNNPGGSFNEAISFCDYFLPKNKIIVIEKSGKQNETYLSKNSGDVKSPLIILINEKSASSSEIVAGCLQNYNRALVIGRKSYGKGSVQQVESLIVLGDNGNVVKPVLKLTRAEYFVAKNIPIQNLGVSLNINMVKATIEKNNIRLSNSKVRREIDRLGALESKIKIKILGKIKFDEFKYPSNDIFINKKYPQFNFDVRLAFKLLEGDGPIEGDVWKSNEFYFRKKDICKSIKEGLSESIKNKFKSLGIVWESGGAFSKNIQPKLMILNFKPSLVVSAGNYLSYKVMIKNESPIAANQVRAELIFNENRLKDQYLYWGKLGKGSSKEISTKFFLNPEFAGCRIPYQLHIFDEHSKLNVLNGVFMVKKLPQLKFSFKYKVRLLKRLPGEDHVAEFLVRIKKESKLVDSSSMELSLKNIIDYNVIEVSISPSIYKDEIFKKDDELEFKFTVNIDRLNLKKRYPLLFSIKDRLKLYEVKHRIELDLSDDIMINDIDWSKITDTINPIEVKIDGEQDTGGIVLSKENLITGSITSSKKIVEIYLTRYKKIYCHNYFLDSTVTKDFPLKLEIPPNAPEGRYLINIKTKSGTTHLRSIFFSRL